MQPQLTDDELAETLRQQLEQLKGSPDKIADSYFEESGKVDRSGSPLIVTTISANVCRAAHEAGYVHDPRFYDRIQQRFSLSVAESEALATACGVWEAGFEEGVTVERTCFDSIDSADGTFDSDAIEPR